MVEDRRHANRDRPHSGLCHSRRASGGLHLYGRHQGRDLHHDRRPGDRRLHLCGDRQAYACASQHRRGRNLCHLCPVGARLLQAAAAADREIGHRIHQVYELPLFVHRLHHRRQHPQHGPPGAGAGISQDIRPAGDWLDRRRDCRHAGRHAAWDGRLSHLLLRGDPNHGRRCRRGRDSALRRLCGNPRRAPRRHVCPGAAPGDARQPHGNPPCRHAQLRRQALSAPDR